MNPPRIGQLIQVASEDHDLDEQVWAIVTDTAIEVDDDGNARHYVQVVLDPFGDGPC